MSIRNEWGRHPGFLCKLGDMGSLVGYRATWQNDKETGCPLAWKIPKELRPLPSHVYVECLQVIVFTIPIQSEYTSVRLVKTISLPHLSPLLSCSELRHQGGSGRLLKRYLGVTVLRCDDDWFPWARSLKFQENMS